jgi:protein-tyrosine phosphatase
MDHPGAAPSVLFVCLGNYIRSPVCEGLLRTLVDPAVVVDSAAVTYDDIGQHPHPHAREIARAHGFDISAHVSRIVAKEDYDRFTVIVSLEPSVKRALVSQKPGKCRAHIVEFIPGRVVRNPWASPYRDFELMYGQIEAGMAKFIKREIPERFLKNDGNSDRVS